MGIIAVDYDGICRGLEKMACVPRVVGRQGSESPHAGRTPSPLLCGAIRRKSGFGVSGLGTAQEKWHRQWLFRVGLFRQAMQSAPRRPGHSSSFPAGKIYSSTSRPPGGTECHPCRTGALVGHSSESNNSPPPAGVRLRDARMRRASPIRGEWRRAGSSRVRRPCCAWHPRTTDARRLFSAGRISGGRFRRPRPPAP